MSEIVSIPKDFFTEKFLENLHSTIFDFHKSGDEFRIDGGYIAKEEDGNISGYVLYREVSKNVIDLAYGGADKSYRGFKTLDNLSKFISQMLESYELITTMVWNKNTKMLKIYMSLEFDIVGTKLSKTGDMFVILEKGKGK